MRFTQWLLGLAVVTVSGISTVWLLSPGEADRLRREKEELLREQIGLQQAIQRLSGEDRIAEIHVLEQIRPGQTVDGRTVDTVMTTIELIEIDREGHPLPSKRFVIPDDVIFFDALVIKFDQERVAAADALRGKSLALFRRVYGEHQNPAEGYAIDQSGEVPRVFRTDPKADEFEHRLWSKFWSYATQPGLAAQEGVRVAQGEAVYVPMQKGQQWTLTLQNNGGLNLKLRDQGASIR